jgi:hypothetical protein
MNKQYNRGQQGAGIACVKLKASPGEDYMFRERAEGSGAISEVFDCANKDILSHPKDMKNNADYAYRHFGFAGELYMGHLRYSATGKTGMGVKVKIVFSTGSATKDKALNESSQVKAINALLVNGKTVSTSLLNEVNGYLHNAVKNKILPAGSTYVAPANTSSSGSFGRVL